MPYNEYVYSLYDSYYNKKAIYITFINTSIKMM